MNKSRIKIKAEGWYSLKDLARGNAFPWCGTDIRPYRKIVLADKIGRDILKATVIGKGRIRRYQIKGVNIINFIRAFESGKSGL